MPISPRSAVISGKKLGVDILVARGQICTMALISGQMEHTNPNVFDAMVAGKFRGKVIYSSVMGIASSLPPSDFKNKNVAVSTFGGLTDMLTREILEQHAMNPAKDGVAANRHPVALFCFESRIVKAALLASIAGTYKRSKKVFASCPINSRRGYSIATYGDESFVGFAAARWRSG